MCIKYIQFYLWYLQMVLCTIWYLIIIQILAVSTEWTHTWCNFGKYKNNVYVYVPHNKTLNAVLY